MDACNSKPKYKPFDLNSCNSINIESLRGDEVKTVSPIARRSLADWTRMLWTLVTHCLLSILITLFVLVYIEGNHFNVSELTPRVRVVGGTEIAPFLPMQSGIITFLSSLITALKCVLVAWAASLCWNVAFFLMERHGITRQNLKTLLKYGILAPSAYSGDWTTWLIGALFLASLVANLSSPILSGSITWIPSNRLVRGLSTDPLQIYTVEDGTLTELPAYYRNNYNIREAAALTVAGSIGWGHDLEKGDLKLSLDALEDFSINSTVDNLVIPYFQVHSIRWIENPNEISFLRDGVTPASFIRQVFDYAPSTFSGFLPGYAVLVPNITTNWSSDPLESTTIHDTRLLMLYYAYYEPSYSEFWTLTKDLPPNAYKLHWNNTYTAYAWVTFSAGVGRCKEHSCIVSSPATVRNNTPVELEPHTLTFQALSMSIVVGINLITQNISLPGGWDNINDYVEAILVRSYSGAWRKLVVTLYTSVANTSYIPSVPSLLADVDQKRVYIWLGTQLLATLLSVVFLVVQSHLSKYPLIGDTSLVAFYLDTAAIPRDNEDVCEMGVQKIEEQEGRLRVKAE